MLRPHVHGLAPEQPVLYCHRRQDITLLLLRGPDDLSQAAFCEGAELIVWPDEETWEGKFGI